MKRIACTLAHAERGAQAERWRRVRSEALVARVETADGLRLNFRDETGVEGELRELVEIENRCCSWARWDVLRDDGEVVLRVSSSGPGVTALHAMLR